MWESSQFIIIIFSIACVLIYSASTLPQFAMYSEVVWLSLYILVSVLGCFVDSAELLSAPFIVLVLTAVEAVIIWTLIVYSSKSKV